MSAANVVAFARRIPLVSFAAVGRSNSLLLLTRVSGTNSSSEDKEIGADESVPLVPSTLLVRRLYQVRLLIFMASHGLVRDSDSD
jgi:hypothetical protein